MAERKTGTTLPIGILSPTVPRETPPDEPRPEPAMDDAEQGGEHGPPVAEATAESRPAKGRKRRRDVAEKLEGRRLYLSQRVFHRLKLTAVHRNQKLSEVAEQILDRNLPEWDLSQRR